MLENARDSLPYVQDADILFKDASGKQAVFEYRSDHFGYERRDYIIEYHWDNNPDSKYVVAATRDLYHYIIIEQTSIVGFDIDIDLGVGIAKSYPPANSPSEVDYLVYDKLDIRFELNQGLHSVLQILVNQREFEKEFLYLFESIQSEVTLLDQTFYNVYSNTTQSDYRKVWYNTDFGVIGFEDTKGNIWVLDSISAI